MEEKCQIVLEAAEMPDVELGGYLRAKGLHDSDLEGFREEVMRSMDEQKSLGRQKTKDRKRIRELEKELKRKEKALAEMAASLVFKKSPSNFAGITVSTATALSDTSRPIRGMKA